VTTRTYCLLDKGAAGDGLSVDEGGTIVTTNVNALDLQRAVLGTIAVSEGTYHFEAYCWSTSRGDLSDLVSIGIARVDAPLNDAIGEAANTYGIWPADGELYASGAKAATFDPIAERNCIGVRVVLSAGAAAVTWYLNGNELHTQELPTGQRWTPAISIGSPEAGDVSVTINAGQSRFDFFAAAAPGWYTETRGLATLYLSLAREGFLSDAGDTPASTLFRPRILNPESFSVKRAPATWWQSGGGSASGSAFGTLKLDNSDGALDSLLDMDVRDATLVLQDLDAPAHGAGSTAAARTVMTACIDSVTSPSAGVLDVRLRDTLARLDKPLPCRVIPPFADEGARGRIYPVGLGAQRNVRPLLFDTPPDTGMPIYVLGDAPMSNVTLVTDGGAMLDPLSAPPQWTSALGGAGIQLDTAPVYRLSADCSSVGEQYTIPGAEDVLAGIGDFATWSGGEPDGWSKPTSPTFPPAVVANGSIAQTSAHGRPSSLRITSNVALSNSPGGSYLGYPVLLDTAPLQPGRTYRITFSLLYSLGTPDPYGNEGHGFFILTKMSRDKRYWVTPHLDPLRVPLAGGRQFTFLYTVPPTELSALGLYLCCASGTNSQTPPTTAGATCVIDDLRVQLLGQYVALPLDGMTLTEAFREILVRRAGEPEGIFSAADTQAIDDETGIRIGARWTEQPSSIRAMLQEIADTYGAVLYTDRYNVIRVRRFRDAERDGATVVADIKTWGARIRVDDAPNLTTSYGVRRNCEPFGDGDYVTDTAGVPPTQREAWSGTSQIRFTTAARPSSEYAFAVGAPWEHLLCDEPGPARALVEEIVSLYAPRDTAASGLNATMPIEQRSGKRKIAAIEVPYDNNQVGATTTVDPCDLQYADVLEVTMPVGATPTPTRTRRMALTAWEDFPFAGKIRLEGNYR